MTDKRDESETDVEYESSNARREDELGQSRSARFAVQEHTQSAATYQEVVVTCGSAAMSWESRLQREPGNGTGNHRSRHETAATAGRLRTPPGERRVLSVVLTADIVPRQPQRVNVAVRGVRDGEPVRGRVARAVEMQRLSRVGTDSNHTGADHFNRSGSTHRPFVMLPVEVNAGGLGPEKFPHEARKSSHRSAGGAARDGANCVALLRARTLVDHDADVPVAPAHRLRGARDDDEPEFIERQDSKLPFFDLKRHGDSAGTLGGQDCHPARDAQTDEVAATGFVVLAAQVPGGCAHRALRGRNC